MAIIFNCRACGKRFEVGDGLAGKRVRCKVCGEEMRVPGEPPPPPKLKPKRRSSSPPPLSGAPDVFGFDDIDVVPLPPRAAIEAVPLPPRVEPIQIEPVAVNPWRASSRPDFRPTKAMPHPEGILPLGLTVLLWILGTPLALGMLALPVLGIARGDERLTTLGFLMIPACAGMFACIVFQLKLIVLASEIKPFYGLIGGFFIVANIIGSVVTTSDPSKRGLQELLGGMMLIATLVFVASYWRYTKIVFCYYAISFVVFIGSALMIPYTLKSMTPKGGQMTQREALAKHGQAASAGGGMVRVKVTGIPSEAAAVVIGKKLASIVDSGGAKGVSRTGSGDVYSYEAFPVAEPQAFADRITFGTVTEIGGRTITVEAGPIDEEELAAESAQLAEQAAGIKARQAHAQGAFDIPDPEPPAGADALTRLLYGLKSSNQLTRKTALRRLSSMAPVEDRRDEVQEALRPLLDSSDIFLVEEAMRTMVTWRTNETIDSLILLTTDSRQMIRVKAIEALGRTRDPRAAGAIAACLREDNFACEAALRQIGEGAEPAVLPLLESADSILRHRACAVLAKIGGQATLDYMKKARPDPDFGVRLEAQRTMSAIAIRLKSRPQ
jgi:hypothetical protein